MNSLQINLPIVDGYSSMEEWIILTPSNINRFRRGKPGAYQLLYRSAQEDIIFVGYSANDLPLHLMEGLKNGYAYFKVFSTLTATDAYSRTCHSFHSLGRTAFLANKRHPTPPAGGLGLPCPVCGYGSEIWTV